MNADALVFSEFGCREGAPLSRRSKSYPRDLVVKCTRLRLFATSLTTPGHVKGLGVVGFMISCTPIPSVQTDCLPLRE